MTTTIQTRPLFTILCLCFIAGCHLGTPQPENTTFASPPIAKVHPAVAKLMEGNERFTTNKATHPLQNQERRTELTAGQHPDAIIVSCSDSRVSPEIAFDTGLGEIFVVRTAGEVVDDAALASIEYAVEHLGAKVIIVMGHESCGAVKAALTTPKGKSAGSPSLDKLVGAIQPHIANIKVAPEDKLLLTPVKANIDGIAEHLAHSSEILHEALSKKKLKIVNAVYHLESGAVEFWNEK